jgi:hypothetical protein
MILHGYSASSRTSIGSRQSRGDSPKEELLRDVYVVKKTGTKQGWSHPAADENWQHGYLHEFEDFVQCLALSQELLCGGDLARHTIAVVYSAYVSAERREMEVEIPPQQTP